LQHYTADSTGSSNSIMQDESWACRHLLLRLLLPLLQAWYPVAAVENLDAEKPNKCTLLGK
jgi:hypothetical protein